MRDSNYIFAGNRFYVLQRMLQQGLTVTSIYAVRNSYLQRALDAQGLEYAIINSSRQLVQRLLNSEFDILISNGLPFILPATEIKENTGAILTNIHPSCLPDLRGVDPVRGAFLYGRQSGATCHHIDDGVDTGDIISQVAIPNTPDLDSGLLYQLCFQAEVRVFDMALERKFKSTQVQVGTGSDIYYTMKPEHREIDWGADGEVILRQIRAFGTLSQGARFSYAGTTIKVLDAEWVTNPFILEQINDYQENQVVFNYENCLLVRKGAAFLKLKYIQGDISAIKPGTILGKTDIE